MNIDELFIKYGSDKSSQHHNFSPVYERILEKYRIQPILMLELGVGGYHYTDRGGGDLKAFSIYLPYALILAVDLHDKTFLNQKDRICTYIADQNDEAFFIDLVSKVGKFDIVIDDASHNCGRCIKSFEILFPAVKSGGYYVVEDVHTSYWNSDEYQGDDSGDPYAGNTMNYFKRLTDVLNWEHIGRKENYGGLEKYADSISSISFYKELITIEKK